MENQDMNLETKKAVRYDGLDGLRTVACIGIVMMHMASRDNNAYTLNAAVASFISTFTDFVFLFMAISAFGMCCGYYEKFLGKGSIDLVDFYKKRYMKILPFFALVVLIDVVVEFDKGVLVEALADVSLTFGLFPNSIGVIGVGWFLGLIFAFYMIFPFYCAAMHSRKSAWIVLIISLALNYITGSYFGQGKKNIVYSFCFFVIGGIIYLYREELSKWKPYVTITAVCVAVALYYGCGYFKISGAGTLTRLMVASALIIFAITEFGCRVLHNRFTAYISQISMEIYLAHMMIFRGIEKLGLNTRFGSGAIQYIITTVLVLAGAVVFSTLFKKCEKFVVEKFAQAK